jgi:hypothetical protein
VPSGSCDSPELPAVCRVFLDIAIECSTKLIAPYFAIPPRCIQRAGVAAEGARRGENGLEQSNRIENGELVEA